MCDCAARTETPTRAPLTRETADFAIDQFANVAAGRLAACVDLLEIKVREQFGMGRHDCAARDGVTTRLGPIGTTVADLYNGLVLVLLEEIVTMHTAVNSGLDPHRFAVNLIEAGRVAAGDIINAAESALRASADQQLRDGGP